MPIPQRTYTVGGASNYRYGFNGKENDNEVKGAGNQQDYGMRIYDPRLGRFLSVDPITGKFPELTPYQFASNTPIQALDIDGLEGVSFQDVMWGKSNFVDWFNNPSPNGALGSFNRNVNPVGILAVNGYALLTGRDFDSGEETSRAGAAINLFALYVFHKTAKTPLGSAPQQLERQMTKNAAQRSSVTLTNAELQNIRALIKQAEANGGRVEATAAKAASTPGEVTYYRVQGGTPPTASKNLISINQQGNASFENATLNISVGNLEHAQYFQSKRPGSQIVQFNVPSWFDNMVSEFAIPQKGYKNNPGNQMKLAPKIVDPRQPGLKYELPAQWSRWLNEYAVPGSGKVTPPPSQ